MLKNFVMRKLIESKLKNLPQDQQEQILKVLEENPDFFVSIAKEIEEKVKGGKDQMSAAMEVMRAHQTELQNLIGKKE